jgi:hypothetical protein
MLPVGFCGNAAAEVSDAGPPTGSFPIHEGYVYGDDDRLILRSTYESAAGRGQIP